MIVYDAPRISRWVCDKAGGTPTELDTGIAIECGGILVAGIRFDGYTGSSIAMHSRVDNPRKITREWLRQIFDYPFNQLNVKRVTGLVCSDNIKAQKTNEHLGWKRETVLADYFPSGDGIVYIMRKEDCRWLKGKQ